MYIMLLLLVLKNIKACFVFFLRVLVIVTIKEIKKENSVKQAFDECKWIVISLLIFWTSGV